MTDDDPAMIYLDHAATTPLDPRVLEAMLPYLTDQGGNASSLHYAGRRARKAVEDAREEVADWVGARPGEIVFTSGGSESDTSAILGLAYARRDRGRHLLTTPIEHHAVLHSCERLAREGFEVEYLSVDPDGFVAAEEVAERLRDETILVSVMHANNEVGTIQPIAEIGRVCAAQGTPLHTDAVQTLGQVRLDVAELGVSLLAASAHKIHGPQGVGFSYVRTGVRPWPWVLGGSQERNRRAGTENVAGIVGLAAAVRLLRAEFDSYTEHCRRLRDRLIEGVLALPGTRLNGPRERRLPNNVNVSFERVSGESLLIMLDGLDIAVSTGSACSSGATDPSHVLLALHHDPDRAYGSLRLTVGRGNRDDDIDQVLGLLPECLDRLRSLSAAPPVG